MDTTIILSVGSFLAILAALVLLRARSTRFEVKPADIVVAVVPVVLFLLVTGKLQKVEIGEGGVKIEAAFVKASEQLIDPQVTPLTGVPAEPVRLDPKEAVSKIPQLIERRTEGLLFRLGHGGYWGPAIEEYFAALTRQPFFKYLIIEHSDGRFFGIVDARALGELLRNPNAPYRADDLARWLNQTDTKVLTRLPGFVAAADAVSTGTDKFQALQRMEALGVERLPAVDEAQRFVGMVERSRLTASLLIDVTKSLQK
ncbi:CBS domain-containing protein [Geoalkalibacter sp.]|uniref:CBS domain-containing protein n=1 Tax=Geoalkalibacter sp. TaxID=3041440 RepID=UPI00272DF560|nr:CBS domain-containing protein [Geoalkalibacter sp.]